MIILTLPFVFVSLVIGLAWAGNPDEVISLPGVNFSLPFKHYTGYLEARDGNQFFYWFFESQRDSITDPVLLWLNGGPGCSSMLGALTENGPLRLVSNQSLDLNRFAWNIRANVLYLESPAEVGFSYNPHHNSTTDDDWVAENNFAALRSFFMKFPHFEKNDFYITGESYGGIYVPTLSVLALRNKFPPNFKGFALGNGYTDRKLNINSKLQFFYYHGFIDDNLWHKLLSGCCVNVTNVGHCDILGNADQFPQCRKIYDKLKGVVDEFQNTTLEDVYNIYNNHKLSDLNLETYLNRPTVRKALHVQPQSLPKWKECNNNMNKTYRKIYHSMKDQVKHLLQSGLKGLIYNGDFDSMCNFFGDMWFSEELGFRTITSLKPWIVERYGFGGMVKQFEHFYYVIVRGAGHMVPIDKPAQALDMIYKFLINA